MRFLSVLFCGLIFFHLPLVAGEHTVSSQISYHSEQESSSGYGFIYQYKLLENFEFEAKYQQSGDLKVINDENIFYGNYDSFSSGINFTKLHHQLLTLKLGLGINVISSSSHRLLVENNAIAPYFQIAASYQVMNNLSLTIGHSSQFNQNYLGTNHSLFFSLNWIFSSNTKSYTKLRTNKDKQISIKDRTLAVPVIDQANIISSAPVHSKILTPSKSMWYVQIGAYQQADNAHKKTLLLKEKYSVAFSVLLHNQYYRVISQSFSTKTAALEYSLYLKNNCSIHGFVNKI